MGFKVWHAYCDSNIDDTIAVLLIMSSCTAHVLMPQLISCTATCADATGWLAYGKKLYILR
jgi:hypothetical protein